MIIRKTTTTSHATMEGLTRKMGGCGDKMYMNNFLSSPNSFDGLTRSKVNSFGCLSPNRKGKP
jgi:hypothetical protein